MRIWKENGILRCPAFDGETGERVENFDLFIGLGAHFDCANKGIGPMKINMGQYIFDFCGHSLDGSETLCVVVYAKGSAQPLRSIPDTEENGLFFYDVCCEYYKRAHASGRHLKGG